MIGMLDLAAQHINQWFEGSINDSLFNFVGQNHVFTCLKKIGFSDECAKIWQYNIRHTKSECFAICIWSWITDEPFNKPDGSLNDCLQ